MADQYTFTNPVTQYTSEDFPTQRDTWPGFDSEITPEADHGETTYRGTGPSRAARRSSPVATPASGAPSPSPTHVRAPTSPSITTPA